MISLGHDEYGLIVQIPDSKGIAFDYRCKILTPGSGASWACMLTKLLPDDDEVVEGAQHLVTFGLRWGCTCRAFRYRARYGKDGCKHSDKARELKELLEKLDILGGRK